MKKLKDPIDSNFFIRLLNLHYFFHIIRTYTLENASTPSIIFQPRVFLVLDLNSLED